MPPHEFFLQDSAKYGMVHGGYDMHRRYLTLNDASMVRALTTKQFADFAIRSNLYLGSSNVKKGLFQSSPPSIQKRPFFAIRSNLYLGSSNVKKGLFWMDGGEDWKRVRSFVTPAFTTGKLKTMMEPIARISDKFIEHLRVHAKTGDEFDIKRYIGGFV